MKKPPSSKKGILSEADEALWEEVMADAESLKGCKAKAPSQQPKKQEPSLRESTEEAPSLSPPASNKLKPEEEIFFKDFIDGKTTLEAFDIPQEKKSASDVSVHLHTKTEVEQFFTPKVAESTLFLIIENTQNCLAGWHPSLDTKVQKALKKGEVKFTQRIDLHGLYLLEAYEVLRNFLEKAQKSKHRCVLIIHGKGEFTTEGIGEIKRNLAPFLASRPEVLAFHTAQPRHGGSGACYVLLRRLKNN